jgi:hypothetical protein
VISIHENVNIPKKKAFYGLSEMQVKLHLCGGRSLTLLRHSGFLGKLLKESKRTLMECNVRRFFLERQGAGRKRDI